MAAILGHNEANCISGSLTEKNYPVSPQTELDNPDSMSDPNIDLEDQSFGSIHQFRNVHSNSTLNKKQESEWLA